MLWVTLAAFATALATGLGALPFLFVRRPTVAWIGTANAVAAGFMLSASGALLVEGGIKSVPRTIVGAGIGAVTVALASRAIGHRDDVSIGALRGADARKAILIVGVMTVHSFSEGIGVGVSYGGGDKLGVFITLAIAVHNIPEGLAISLVLIPRGATVAAAALLERLLEPPAAVDGRSRIPLRRGVQELPPGRARLRRGRDGVARLRGARARGVAHSIDGRFSVVLALSLAA